MNSHSEKTPESQNKSAVNNGQQSCGKGSAQLADKRPEAIAQRKLQEASNNSPRAMQLKSFQDIANNSIQSKPATQLQTLPFGGSGEKITQLARKEYKTVAHKPAGFNKNNWPDSLSSGGQKANSSIANKANETLADMGWGNKVNLMSAHMIPKRLGGLR